MAYVVPADHEVLGLITTLSMGTDIAVGIRSRLTTIETTLSAGGPFNPATFHATSFRTDSIEILSLAELRALAQDIAAVYALVPAHAWYRRAIRRLAARETVLRGAEDPMIIVPVWRLIPR